MSLQKKSFWAIFGLFCCPVCFGSEMWAKVVWSSHLKSPAWYLSTLIILGKFEFIIHVYFMTLENFWKILWLFFYWHTILCCQSPHQVLLQVPSIHVMSTFAGSESVSFCKIVLTHLWITFFIAFRAVIIGALAELWPDFQLVLIDPDRFIYLSFPWNVLFFNCWAVDVPNCWCSFVQWWPWNVGVPRRDPTILFLTSINSRLTSDWSKQHPKLLFHDCTCIIIPTFWKFCQNLNWNSQLLFFSLWGTTGTFQCMSRKNHLEMHRCSQDSCWWVCIQLEKHRVSTKILFFDWYLRANLKSSKLTEKSCLNHAPKRTHWRISFAHRFQVVCIARMMVHIKRLWKNVFQIGTLSILSKFIFKIQKNMVIWGRSHTNQAEISRCSPITIWK
jgi:hypothetical protein